MESRDRFRGCLLGLAIGDALGMSVEHWPRGTFEARTGLEGGGPFDREPGQWTDDTAMAIALATSLIEKHEFDAGDQMERYCKWAAGDFLGQTGTRLDIGGTIAEALMAYKESGDPYSGSTDPQAAGNGCIMRLAPVPMYYSADLSQVEHFAGLSARTTHGAPECVASCRLLARTIWRALQGQSKDEVLNEEVGKFVGAERVCAIANGDYMQKAESEICGSGYVVESLEAALWCFDQTDTFAAAVLYAVNLGDDTDTTAAVCGQIAGAFYGVEAIPWEWADKLAMREELERLADRLMAGSGDIAAGEAT